MSQEWDFNHKHCLYHFKLHSSLRKQKFKSIALHYGIMYPTQCALNGSSRCNTYRNVYSRLYIQHKQPMISGHGRWDRVLQKKRKRPVQGWRPWYHFIMQWTIQFYLTLTNPNSNIFFSSSLNKTMLDAWSFKAI